MRSILIFTVAITVISCLPVPATIINVPNEYATIQAGIDASSDGDTVLVASGTYTGVGNVNLATNGKAILVKGDSLAIIDGQAGSVKGFNLDDTDEDSTTIIEGFTITNAEEGIWLFYASPKLVNLKLISNTSQGIRAYIAAGPIIRDCEFINNAEGVRVDIESGCPTTIRNCLFRNNSTGISLAESIYNFLANGCTFDSNGTGVYSRVDWPLHCKIDSCDFTNNNCALTGGFTISNSYIAGGGGFSIGIEYYISNCLIENIVGLVFSISGPCRAEINNSIIRNCTDRVAYIGTEGTLEINNCRIYGNAGGIYATNWWPILRMNDCLYYDNHSPIEYYPASGGRLNISQSTIYGNHSTGINVLHFDDNGYFIVTNTIIAGNDGCGIKYNYESDPNYDISYCDVYDNESDNYCDFPDLTGQDGNISCDPQLCWPDTGNFYLAASSCCIGTGSGGGDIGAYGTGCGFRFEYFPGDVNMAVGAWPPSVFGSDVIYLVNYFRGLPTSTSCLLQGFWCSADINGDCRILGGDVTALVNYFRGLNGLDYCPDYEPAWILPEDRPALPPTGWPNCE